MRGISKARAAENRIRRRLRQKLIEERGPGCEIGMTVICSGRFDDMHEILSRARGGSITDPDNILLVCRSCHRWVTENPWAAEDLGASRKASQDPEAAKIKRAEKLPVWRNDLQSASDW